MDMPCNQYFWEGKKYRQSAIKVVILLHIKILKTVTFAAGTSNYHDYNYFMKIWNTNNTS